VQVIVTLIAQLERSDLVMMTNATGTAGVWQQALGLDARYNAYRTPNNPQFSKNKLQNELNYHLTTQIVCNK